MKILVLVKQVPDTWSERTLDLETGRVDRSVDPVIDEINEKALEVALLHKDAAGADVTAVSMGPAGVVETLRKALAMGANDAVHVLDDALEGADMAATAAVLAAAIKRAGFDLVIAGNESTDGRGGALAAMIAEHLGVPHVTALDRVEISDSSVTGERATEYGTSTVSAPLPAVISVTERIAEPRFPNFRGIMQAKKKPLETVTLADLGVEAATLSTVLSVAERPERGPGTKIVDEGDAATQLVEYLAAQHLI